MKDRIKRMKQDLKGLAAKRKEVKIKGNRYTGYLEYRSKHIAYCLLRGTPYEKIESKHRHPEDGTHEYVKKEADKITEKVLKGELYGAEDICISRQEIVPVPASSSVWARVAKLLS